MTYPTVDLVIIGPIIFLCLVIIFPIIGAFGGWKRAAYWGGGNFVIFIIGMLIFRFAGEPIANSLSPAITNLLKALIPSIVKLEPAQLTGLINTLVGPITFVLMFMIGNLLLLINYYAWFKRVSGIQRDVLAKREVRKAKRENRKPTVDYKNWHVLRSGLTEKDLVKVQTTKHKVVYYTVGSVSMLALMAPFTIATTQTIMYVTSTSGTRKTNGFADGVFTFVDGVNKNMSWASFYCGVDVGGDFNSALTGLNLYTTEVNTWINPSTGQEETLPAGVDNNAVTVIGETVNVSFGELKEVFEEKSVEFYSETLTQESADEIETTGNNIVAAWNNIVEMTEKNNIDVAALFGSSNLIKAVTDVIIPAGTTVPISAENVELLTENELINNVIDGLTDGKEILIPVGEETLSITLNKIKKIQVEKSVEEDIGTMICKSLDLSAIEQDEELVTDFRSVVDKLLGVIFEFK